MLLRIGGGSDALPMQQLATAPVLQTAALPNSSSGLPSAFEQLMLGGDRRPLPGMPGNGLNMPLPGMHSQPFGGAPAPLPTAPVGTSPFAAGGTAMPYGLPHPAMAPAPVSRPPGLPPGLGFGSTPGRDPLVAPPPPLPGVAPLPDALIEQLLGGAPAGQRQRMPPLPTDQSRFFPSTPPPAPAPPAPAPQAPAGGIEGGGLPTADQVVVQFKLAMANMQQLQQGYPPSEMRFQKERELHAYMQQLDALHARLVSQPQPQPQPQQQPPELTGNKKPSCLGWA